MAQRALVDRVRRTLPGERIKVVKRRTGRKVSEILMEFAQPWLDWNAEILKWLSVRHRLWTPLSARAGLNAPRPFRQRGKESAPADTSTRPS